MEFDKSRVYTTVNAGELKVGSKCIFAHNLSALKDCVEEDDEIETLVKIREENYCDRFYDGSDYWNIAYLISEPGEKRLHWTDLKVGDVIAQDDTIALVNQIDKRGEYNSHIRAGDHWLGDSELSEWQKVEE